MEVVVKKGVDSGKTFTSNPKIYNNVERGIGDCGH